MAFKSVDAYNQERYHGMFMLQNDGDFADVIFMYRSKADVLVADTHYIKSGEYTGYIHCCGRGCPACAKGIRVQPKLFIPLYVIREDKVLFFDRSIRFDSQLQESVFSKYPNPSEFVFRITRRGASCDINTRYEIMAVGRNTVASYDQILAKLNIKMPDYYSEVCREYSSVDVNQMIHVTSSVDASYSSDIPDYQVSARRSVNASLQPTVNDMEIPEIPDVPSIPNDISGLDSEVTSAVDDYSSIEEEIDNVDF